MRETAVAYETETDLPFDQAVQSCRDALAREGFGVLTEIDVQATLKEKLGVEAEHYIILGVCNPRLAHRALEVDRTVGLLLPCTVVVREQADGVLVEALDPSVIASVPGNPALEPIAAEAGELILAALDDLAGQGET